MRIRNAVAVLAVGLASGSAAGAPCAGFTDVDDTSIFCVSISWMKNRSITLGCATSLYCPNDFVTREHMAAFLYRLGINNAFLQGGNAFGATAVIGTTDNRPVEVNANGARVMRFEPRSISPNLVAGFPGNVVASAGAGQVIAGGGYQDPNNCFNPISGGFDRLCRNEAIGPFAAISGGYGNRAGEEGAIGGGSSNEAGNFAAVAGGTGNAATSPGSVVGGGVSNQATAANAVVSGGTGNRASGSSAMVPGGLENLASGPYSFAGGRRAKASYQGAFLWADSTNLDFKVQASEFTGPGSGWPDAANTFNVRATGGVWLVTGVDGTTGRPSVGAFLRPGEGTWNVTSDAASKRDVSAVDPQEVLAKALTIEVSRWRYRTAPGIEHIGPMAQDFHRAFNVGLDDRSIATVDADGVALAAIQGLNAKLEAKVGEQARELASQRSEIEAQFRELSALRRMVEALVARP